MSGTIVAISSYLRSIHLKVPNEWVEACVDWLQDEYQNPGDNLSLEKIKKLVYEQWLVADLTELGMQYLPPQVSTAEKYLLTGHFCLQVNSMIDISTPFYLQQIKLKGIDTTNSSISYDEPKKVTVPHSRMLKLELTDGTTNVYGMEYNSIPDLKLDLKPGFKVLIEGDILCRKGMLMLKKENIQVLGGEVDSLMEANTNQTLLLKAMEDSAKYATKYKRQEFKAADSAKYIDRIKPGFYKKGQDLPGTHNTKTVTTGNTSKFSQEKNSSFNCKSSTSARESWKPSHDNFSDSITGVDDFDEEWAANELDDDEFLDDALVSATQQSSLVSNCTENPSSTFDTTLQQQSNKKRSFSPYEINNCMGLPKKKTLRLSPTQESTPPNDQGGLFQSFDDTINIENWDDDEMEIAMTMDTEINKSSCSSSSIKTGDFRDLKAQHFRSDHDISLNSVSASSPSISSFSRPCQINDSMLSNKPKEILDCDTFIQLKSTEVSINSSINELIKKWFKLCENVQTPNTFANLMKVDSNRLPFTYLFVLQQCPPHSEDMYKFRIKGYISTLLGKLERIDRKWKLMCTLNDGTGTLPVLLSDEVLTQLIGYSVKESIEMTSNGSDPTLKKKLQEGVKQCQLKIVSLNCIFEIETNQNYSHPLVTKITTINAGHIQQLRQQVTKALSKI